MGWLSKDQGAGWGDRATDARELRRKSGACVRCVIELEDGTVHDGAMTDISASGAGVHGSTDGVHLGDHLRLIATTDAGQKLRYRCEVKHINREHRKLGVEFLTRPEALDADYEPKAKSPDGPEQTRNGCPRCAGQMEFGHLVEHVHLTSSAERTVQARWAAGPLVRSPLRTEDSLQPVQYMRVDTYRCTGCGYIESYALEPYEGPS